MIDSRKLLEALRKVLKQVEDFAREHIDAHADLEAALRAEWQQARDSGRVGSSYHDWRDEEITQAAVHWVLACVYLRFIEDNGLCDRPWLSGATRAQRDLAQDRYEQHFRARPLDSDEHYLRACFEDAARLPAMGGLFDRNHNPLWRIGATGDGAKALLDLLRGVDPDTGQVRFEFCAGPPSPPAPLPGGEGRPETLSPWGLPPSPPGGRVADERPFAIGGAGGEGPDTRFLGDLYQDLSEPVRKKYALLQTPIFVEEFILDRTLTPALAEFGYRVVRLIDPTCGSGHFLLGAFRRLFDLWAANEPARNLPDLAQRALDGVYGVDLNPYAVAIARFRLTMAALAAAGIRRLADAPDFRVHVAVGDSLIHGQRSGALDLGGEAENLGSRGLAHAYATEDLEAVNGILGQRYHAVVGNPPYITVKDSALSTLYRQLYSSCHRSYSLVVPFTERFFDLALPPSDARPAGYVGLIAADSFMKREFGKKLIETFLPRIDLTHVIGTSGAYIPGHGTPTVILFGRNRRPVAASVRTVMGIKGEPSPPADPAKGLVWTAILAQVDRPGSEGEFVSVADVPRATLAKHPWSIGGGGASELRNVLDKRAATTLRQIIDEVGFGVVTREDDAYMVSRPVARRQHVEPEYILPLVAGEDVRDWGLVNPEEAIWPYDSESLEAEGAATSIRFLWPYRPQLSSRVAYGLSQLERGLRWFEYSMFFRRRFASPLAITFAEVATHNHFVLDRGGKVFNRTAPVIKLPAGTSEDDHLALLGLLNSSTGCFWLKQVCFPKGGDQMGGEGARVSKNMWEERFAHDGTKVSQFPLVEPYPTDLARRLDTLAQELSACLPAAILGSLPAGSLGSETTDA